MTLRLPRSTSNTSRKSPMGRSMRGFISSTTSRPTKKARTVRLGGRRSLLGQLMEQSETPTRELTLEEAVALAILLQKNEQLAEAQELYRRVLETAPDHPRRAALCRRARASTGTQRRSGRAHREEPRARAGSGGLATATSASSSNRPASWTQRSTPTGVRSPSTRATRMRTAISACC